MFTAFNTASGHQLHIGKVSSKQHQGTVLYTISGGDVLVLATVHDAPELIDNLSAVLEGSIEGNTSTFQYEFDPDGLPDDEEVTTDLPENDVSLPLDMGDSDGEN